MKIHVCARLGLGVLLVAGLWACEADEPSRVALGDVEAAISAELCDRVFSCSCDQGRYYRDVLDCEQDAARIAQQLELLPTEYPAAASLTYDPACVGQMIDLLAEIGCGSTLPEPPSCERPCHYYFGRRHKGEACDIPGNEVSDCAQGLRCSGGRCIDPCGGLDDPCAGSSCAPGLLCSPVSDTCRPPPAEGQPCLNDRCGEGFYCDFSEPAQTCKALPLAGEPCLAVGDCADGLFCAAVDPADPMSERKCFAPQPLQAPCQGHAQCESGYCPAGYCQARPDNGEACPAEVCTEGFDCVDEVCQPADAALCLASVPYL